MAQVNAGRFNAGRYRAGRFDAGRFGARSSSGGMASLFPISRPAFHAGGFKPPVPQPDRLFAGGVAGFWAGYFKVKK